ncbi:hypothetical protein THAOC_28376, partial [Thalassiosira oceanica]
SAEDLPSHGPEEVRHGPPAGVGPGGRRVEACVEAAEHVRRPQELLVAVGVGVVAAPRAVVAGQVLPGGVVDVGVAPEGPPVVRLDEEEVLGGLAGTARRVVLGVGPDVLPVVQDGGLRREKKKLVRDKWT